MSFGKQLAQLRRRYGRMTQAELSKRSGVGPVVISRIERGFTQPEYRTLIKLLAVFKNIPPTSISVLLRDDIVNQGDIAPLTHEEIDVAERLNRIGFNPNWSDHDGDHMMLGKAERLDKDAQSA